MKKVSGFARKRSEPLNLTPDIPHSRLRFLSSVVHPPVCAISPYSVKERGTLERDGGYRQFPGTPFRGYVGLGSKPALGTCAWCRGAWGPVHEVGSVRVRCAPGAFLSGSRPGTRRHEGAKPRISGFRAFASPEAQRRREWKPLQGAPTVGFTPMPCASRTSFSTSHAR